MEISLVGDCQKERRRGRQEKLQLQNKLPRNQQLPFPAYMGLANSRGIQFPQEHIAKANENRFKPRKSVLPLPAEAKLLAHSLKRFSLSCDD